MLVVFSRFADAAALERSRATLAASPQWAEAAKAAAAYVDGPPQTLRLAPTARSLLRASALEVRPAGGLVALRRLS